MYRDIDLDYGENQSIVDDYLREKAKSAADAAAAASETSASEKKSYDAAPAEGEKDSGDDLIFSVSELQSESGGESGTTDM